MVGDREVTEDEFMAIVAALPKLRVSIIASWLEKHADGAISPFVVLICGLWEFFLLEICKMHNDKDNMPIASDNDQWAKKQIGLKSFKYVKVFANLKQFGVLVEIC